MCSHSTDTQDMPRCQEILAEMVHTKDGSRVVRELLARGNAKVSNTPAPPLVYPHSQPYQDRKQILKVLKPHIKRMCLDDEAQLVLFTALDTIEYVHQSHLHAALSDLRARSDTKLLAKSIIAPITEVLSSTPKPGGKTAPLHTTPQGRRSLIHLLTPRTRRHFTPAQIALMEETDAVRDQTSKKPAALRQDEVRKAASPDLVSWINDSGESVVTETGACLVITEIMLYADGGLSPPLPRLLSA